MWITYSTAKALNPTAVALGNFDGLHRGHQKVIQPVLNFVKSQETLPATSVHNSALIDSTQQVYSTVVSFNPHPKEFFSGQSRALLTPLEEKKLQLSIWGIQQLVLLPFDRELVALSPEDFVEKILVQQLGTQTISVGEDFCFGKQRSGTANDLQAIAAKFGIPVTVVPNFTWCGDRVSSSAIRQALTEGNLQRAKQLLGRPYILTGTVVKGQQLGRTIGFPTANLQLLANKFLPRQGVYAVRVLIEGERLSASGEWRRRSGERLDSSFVVKSELLPADKPPSGLVPGASRLNAASSYSLPLAAGVMNIGYRPTINGTTQSVEIHLLDWSGDLYGKNLTVELEEFLRPEQKFADLEELKAQINADCTKAKSLLMPEQSSR